MKGLLIKDYKLMLGQKSFLGMAALMAVLYLIIYKDPYSCCYIYYGHVYYVYR
ncbi:MAG: hypothetical protein ACLSGB_10185 [Dorea sp.]